MLANLLAVLVGVLDMLVREGVAAGVGHPDIIA
jgi:hypothetical protein